MNKPPAKPVVLIFGTEIPGGSETDRQSNSRLEKMEAARIQSAATVSPEARSAAAAEKLGYTLSGISRSMMTLEKEAGFQLLQRKKSGSDWQHHVTRRLRRSCSGTM